MITAREVRQIAERVFNARKYRIRTHVMAQVVSYDAASNTVAVQPVTRAIRITDADNLTTVDLPQVSEVPVHQVGAGKLWCTVAPTEGSYGLLHISDRIIDDWLAAGGVVDPTSIRCHDISDAVFEPSYLPLVEDGDNGALVEPVQEDRISLRTRTGLTEVSVLDDETVEVNVNDGKATVSIDTSGNVSITSDGDVTITSDGNVTTSATETVVQDGTDWAIQFTAMKTAFDQLKNELNALVTVYNAHIHITTATVGMGPPGVIAPTVSTGTSPTASMDGAKITDVRLP
jgi:hypothetical protein